MSISIFKSKQCQLAHTMTALGTDNFAYTNVCKTILRARKSVHANSKFVEPWIIIHKIIQYYSNQFETNVPFPYPLKTSKNLCFIMFQWGIEMEH